MSLNENRNISAVSPTSEMSSLEIALQDQGTPMSLPQRPAAIWGPIDGWWPWSCQPRASSPGPTLESCRRCFRHLEVL